MLIVDNRDYIRKVLEEQGVPLLDFHEGHKIYSVQEFCQIPLKKRRSDVLLIDTQSVLENKDIFESCKPTLNTFQGTYFFHDANNKLARDWVHDQASYLPKILGECPLPMPAMSWTLFTNQLQFFWTLLEEQRLLQRQMAEFSQELDQVLQTAEWEKLKAKRIHETLLPRRTEEIKGIQFFNKYATGEGSGGGEFSDLIQSNNKVYQFLMTSDSYLISSSLLGLLNGHKNNDFDPETFLAEAREDVAIINSSKKKKADVKILILELDLSSLSLKSFGNHKSEFCSQLNGKVVLAPGKDYELSKGEKFIVFSPGFIFNWNENSHNQDIYSFVKSHQALKQQDLMTELFFQVRKVQDKQFLKKDATVLMMEVNRHGMHQV